MSDVYQPTAYRSDAIPELPPGGHPDMDKVFQRLPWGHYVRPEMPNTMVAQLAYARLFTGESDAEDGFPWGESVFSVSKGFMSRLQGSLYMLYMCCAVGFFVSLIPVLLGIITILFDNPTINDFVSFLGAMKYLVLLPLFGYIVGKYGRLLMAYIATKRDRRNPTGLYRREGMVRIQDRKGVFEAPFIEFDAYLVHTPSGRGGRYFNLVLQHRYSKRQLWMKGLLTDAMEPKEVQAYWQMIQQFMDVTRPLPDVPIFEPFRTRDPVTREWDERTDRDPFKWRKMNPEDWRKNHEQTWQDRLR